MEFYVKEVKKTIKEPVTIIAATKYFDAATMRQLYNEGISHFGENRVEAFLEKSVLLEDLDITWHIIGTLQTKKAKKVLEKIDYLHSLDNMKLALEIQKRRTTPLKCFIQVNISNEESKHGLSISEVIPFINQVKDLSNIELVGFMGMAENSTEERVISNEFQKLNELQIEVKDKTGLELNELSIGMSNDYLIALKHNATFIRLGSVLFRKEV